jgi:hypothetical protein
MNRRTFIHGALATLAASTAISTLPLPALASLPILHGDGETDDSPAVEALLRGEHAIDRNGKLLAAENGIVNLARGTYYFSRSPFRVPAAITLVGA